MKTFRLIVTTLVLFCNQLVISQAQSLDSTVTMQIDSLIKVSRDLTSKREFDKALELNSIAEELGLKHYGKQSVAYGNCCHNRGRIFYYMNDWSNSEKWYIEAINIRATVLGKEHKDYILTLYNLGHLFYERGIYDEGEKYYLESKSIGEIVLGKKNQTYANILNSLGNLYSDLGAFDKAEEYYLNSMNIRSEIMGKEHPDYAQSLNNLGILYSDIGDYDQSLQFHLEAKSIREKVLGKEHHDYSQSLDNLGSLYFNMGDFDTAEKYSLESKKLTLNLYGPDDPAHTYSLHNLGNIYLMKGLYSYAEQYYGQALKIKEKVLGKHHPEYAGLLNNLGYLHFELGNYDKAEKYYLDAIIVYDQVLEKAHPEFANIYSNLGNLYWKMRKYPFAEKYYLESKLIRHKELGEKHPDYAKIVYNLSTLYLDMGDFEKAEMHITESSELIKKYQSPQHHHYAACLLNLGSLHLLKGDFAMAEKNFLDAKEIYQNSLGKSAPEYSECLFYLSSLYEKMGREYSADEMKNELFHWLDNRLYSATTYLSEAELSNFNKKFEYYGYNLLSTLWFRRLNKSLSPSLVSISYNYLLGQKGFLCSAIAHLNTLVHSSEMGMELYNSLKTYKYRLNQEYATPISDRNDTLVKEYEERVDQAEKELTRIVAGYAEAKKQIKWKDIQITLLSGEVAVEFLHFHNSFPDGKDSTLYAALILRPKREGNGDSMPIFVPLFEQRQLESRLEEIAEDRTVQIKNLFIPNQDQSTLDKGNLYDIIWKPILDKLDDTKTIYYSPSGLLHRINLSAVPIPSTQADNFRSECLSDQYNLVELISTRELVGRSDRDYKNQNAVIYGGISYDVDTGYDSEPIVAYQSTRGALSFQWIDSTLRTNSWNYLPQSQKESQSIVKLLAKYQYNAEFKSGNSATEESFKNLGSGKITSPRILHLATHGYFFPDPDRAISSKSGVPNDSSASEETAKAASSRTPLGNESAFKMSEHPMLRSGLILAGGNAAWNGERTQEGNEDGVLTAYEISQLNLSQTELVVLSACETGLGDIKGYEGVYGLQRAFKIAGVKNIIMSLWQVDDEATSILMKEFYLNLLANKKSIRESLTAAQNVLRNQKRFNSPYYWAGWVLLE